MDGRPHRWYKAGMAGRWSELSSLKLESFFFKVWNYFYSLTHSKERYKVYKRGRDPWSRHVPNSWEAAVSAAPFLIRALLLRTPRPKLKEIILNLFFRFFFAWCKTLIASVFINLLKVKLITKVEFSQRYKDSFITLKCHLN